MERIMRITKQITLKAGQIWDKHHFDNSLEKRFYIVYVKENVCGCLEMPSLLTLRYKKEFTIQEIPSFTFSSESFKLMGELN